MKTTEEETHMREKDYREIADLRAKYAEMIDLGRWSHLREVFAAEITFSSQVTVTAPAPKPATLRAIDWAENVRFLRGSFVGFQHTMNQQRIEVADDVVTVTTYSRSDMFSDFDAADGWYAIGGYYTDRVDRLPEGWRITSFSQTCLWQRGDYGVLRDAHARLIAAGSTPPPGRGTSGWQHDM